MTTRHPKLRIYDQLARIGRALSSPRRLELLDVLAQGERSVDSLAHLTGLSVANASHHLRVLRDARLAEARRQGLHVYYGLAGQDVFELFRSVRQLGESRLAEVERIIATYLTARDQLEPIRREELLERARAGTVLVVDVRPTEEYAAGHIAGAISVPVGDLARRLSEFPLDREIIAYCRGPYCVMAFEALEVLRGHGRPARRLEDGLPEWRSAGLPVEVS